MLRNIYVLFTSVIELQILFLTYMNESGIPLRFEASL